MMEKNTQQQLEENIINEVNGRLTRKNGAVRVIASLLDFVFVAILASILSVTIGFPIANKLGLSNAAGEATILIARSRLYELDEDNSYVVITNQSKYPQAIYGFYVDLFDDETGEYVRGVSPLLKEDSGATFNSLDDYYDVILKRGQEETLFDFSVTPENPWEVMVLEGKEDAAKAFYVDAFNTALNQFYRHEDLVRHTNNFIGGNIATVVISFIVAALPLYLLVPVLNKDGVTLGKLLTNTTVVNKYGYSLTKQQALFRGLTGFVLYYLLFILPLGFISLVLIAFTKKEKTLTDYVAYTVVIDKKRSIYYRDATEEKYYNIRRAKSLVQIRKRQDKVERTIIDEKNLNN